jgi:hypothetical protein
MTKRTESTVQEVSIPSVDDDACQLTFERHIHFNGTVDFYTTMEFDGSDTNIRISRESAQALHDWLEAQLAG